MLSRFSINHRSPSLKAIICRPTLALLPLRRAYSPRFLDEDDLFPDDPNRIRQEEEDIQRANEEEAEEDVNIEDLDLIMDTPNPNEIHEDWYRYSKQMWKDRKAPPDHPLGSSFDPSSRYVVSELKYPSKISRKDLQESEGRPFFNSSWNKFPAMDYGYTDYFPQGRNMRKVVESPKSLEDDLLFDAIQYTTEDGTLWPNLHPFMTDPDWRVHQLLKMGRHTKVTPGGRLISFSSLVLMGNGMGSAGLGYGKGFDVATATMHAEQNCVRDMISIPLYRGCTLSRDVEYKYKKSHVRIYAKRRGYGIRAAPEYRLMLKAFGIVDVSVVTWGRKNKHNIYTAFFKGIHKYASLPEDIAAGLGKKLFAKNKVYYYKNRKNFVHVEHQPAHLR
eukprot:TRINITY_DN11717_c0_g1_i1.p1 TRINITY_DN11717_c0_g1~~TRINITY_DN11717_c0_g1_i1.p1  ORF type:complete len:389 (-),score=57.00 TRINITY_DN11717_c0_g1_i1:75-1241(-)